MKPKSLMMAALAGIALLAGWSVGASAPVEAVSATVTLDTRSVSAVADIDDQDLDTRSYTEAYSLPRNLSTKANRTVIWLR